MLLDNDFFGQPEQLWRARTEELREGDFKVAFSQGVNIRMITEETAHELSTLQLRDNEFERRRLYTAWDNLRDEATFFRGVDLLEEVGIPPKQLMVYMLVGYAKGETMQQVMHRFSKIRDRGCLPYPMVYDRSNRALCAFQRWVIKRYHQFVPWRQYSGKPRRVSTRPHKTSYSSACPPRPRRHLVKATAPRSRRQPGRSVHTRPPGTHRPNRRSNATPAYCPSPSLRPP